MTINPRTVAVGDHQPETRPANDDLTLNERLAASWMFNHLRRHNTPTADAERHAREFVRHHGVKPVLALATIFSSLPIETGPRS